MAKKNEIKVNINVDDKGDLKQVAQDSKKAKKGLDGVAKGARTADRNLKGAAKASSNSTKNFSKMAQGGGGLVAMYATLAATMFAVSAAFQFFRESANFANLIKGQEALGAVTGTAYKTITASVQEATNAQLKYADAASSIAIGTAAGLSPTQLTRLGKAAKNTSIALGRDLTDSFNRLIRGVTKAEPELLDELGIILRLDNATRKYGLSINKSAKDLTEFERSQAVANEVLEQAERKFGMMEKMMDPNATALNQFSKAFDDVINKLRTGIAPVLGVIASFFSQHIYALIAVTGLFAGSILKQLVPNMDEWKEKQAATLKANNKGLRKHRKEMKATLSSYADLTKAENAALKKADKRAKKALKGRSGAGMDFLRGSNDSPAAQGGAASMLNAADKQLLHSKTVLTGKLKGLNMQQVVDLQKSYNQRALLLKKHETLWHRSLQRMGVGFKVFAGGVTVAARTMYGGLITGLVAFGAKAATVGAFLSSAFFWVGLAVIAFSALKAAWDHFNPPSEKMEKLNKAVEASVSHYSNLNDELDRSKDVRDDFGMLTLTENLINQGNAMQSIDIPAVIRAINALDPKADNYKKLKKELKGTVAHATALDSRFAALNDHLGDEHTAVLKAAADNYRNWAKEMVETKFHIQQLPSLVLATDSAMSKLIGTLSKPFGFNVMDAVEAEMESSAIVVAALRGQFREYQRDLSALEKRGAPALVSETNWFTGAPSGVPTAKSLEAVELYKEEVEIAQKRRTENGLELEALDHKLLYLTAFNTRLRKASTEINLNNIKEQNGLRAAQNLRTIGVTIEERLNNLTAGNIIQHGKILDIRSRHHIIEAQVLALQQKQRENGLTTGEEEKLKNALAAKLVSETAIEAEEARIVLVDKRYVQQQAILAVEKSQISVLAAKYEIEKNIRDIALDTRRNSSGIESFGQAKAEEEIANQKDLLREKIKITLNDDKRIKNELNTNATLKQADKDRHQAALRQSQDKRTYLLQELAIMERQQEVLLNSVRTENENYAIKLQGLTLAPINQLYNDKLAAWQAANGAADAETQAALYEQVETQYALTEAINAKAEAYGAVESHMTSALGNLIKGTESVKEAFQNMAIGILEALADIIAQMLIARALQAALGGFMSAGTSAATATSAITPALSSAASSGDFMGTLDTSSIKLASGGVAKGSDAGYPATLHGTEAVVPLPNNRSIPVDLKGAGGQNNNVTVNVAMDGGSSGQQTATSNGQQGVNLGNAIAQAVQKELQNQKRSGGILNPYGVA